MDPATLVPVPDALPVAWGWFQFLLIVTFILHLLFMNAMVGGSIIALVTHLRASGNPPPLVRDLSGKIPHTIAFAVNFGVAPLLFLQVLYGHFFYTSSVLMATYWLSVIGILIVAYYCAYLYKFRFDTLGDHGVKVLGFAVVLLLVIGFLFTNNMTLMLRPEVWIGYFDQPTGFLLNLNDPTLVPRYLHFMTASVAVGGLLVAGLGWFKVRRQYPGAGEQVEMGMGWFTRATVVQIIIGLWFLISLPEDVRSAFLGGSLLHTILLGLAVSAAFLSLFLGYIRQVWPTVSVLSCTVLFMVLMRDLVRRAYLAPYFELSDLAMAKVPQYGLMLLFFVILVAGLVSVFYMLKFGYVALRSEKEVRS